MIYETNLFMFVLGSFEHVSSGLHFGFPFGYHFASQSRHGCYCRCSRGSGAPRNRGLMPETLPGGVQGVPTGVRLGGGTLNSGLTGAQLPPPGPSPSTEKERKRVDVYTRKYTLESTTLTRRLPPTGVGGYCFPQAGFHFSVATE